MHTNTMPTPRAALLRAALATVLGNVLFLAITLAYGLVVAAAVVTIIEQPVSLHGVLVIAFIMMGVGFVNSVADRLAAATRPLRETLHEHRRKAA